MSASPRFAELRLPEGNAKPVFWALAYARASMPVFPCGADKRPLVEHGFKDASTNPEIIKAWWTKWPHADIGWAAPGEIVVADLDMSKGRNGFRDFAEKAGISVDAVETPQTSTPSGGRHLIYAANGASFRNGVAVAGSGIDVRTAGGYVVLPGPGSGRLWKKSPATPLAEAPAWLIAATRLKPQAPAGEARPFSGRATPRAARKLDEACTALANAGPAERDRAVLDHVLRVGSLAAAGELESDDALRELVAAGECNEGAESYRPDKIERAFWTGHKSPAPPQPSLTSRPSRDCRSIVRRRCAALRRRPHQLPALRRGVESVALMDRNRLALRRYPRRVGSRSRPVP
jgi:hypothetical protein